MTKRATIFKKSFLVDGIEGDFLFGNAIGEKEDVAACTLADQGNKLYVLYQNGVAVMLSMIPPALRRTSPRHCRHLSRCGAAVGSA